MKYFFDHLAEFENFLSQVNIAFFDFDMTLAPVAKKSEDAYMPLPTRQALVSLSSLIPVGIVSGRALYDIRTRVNVDSIMYAGNHGAEWYIQGQNYSIPFKRVVLSDAVRKLKNLANTYPQDTFLEDKKYTVAFHYRMARKALRGIIEEKLKSFHFPHVIVRSSKMTYEVRPLGEWNKGSVCVTMMKYAKKSGIPLYIGDDLTDEDAFNSLHHGITIRVGKSNKSKAHYYLKNQKEVITLLNYLLLNINK